jgi:NADH:ubiquinone oxidoreductase subunit F (NADH-binding)/(2Fe-2S) ferredoxin/NAD-dependent dihydropyrimidine dehydrogenase PreA subunit
MPAGTVTATPGMILRSPEELETYRDTLRGRRKRYARKVHVCIGTGCAAKGSRRLYELFCEAAAKHGGNGAIIESKGVGCHGFCELGPIVVIEPEQILYHGVEESDVEEIFRETVLAGRVVERLLYADPQTGSKIKTPGDIPFYREQKRIVLERNGRIDPTSIDDYLADGGYSPFAAALSSMEPEQVIEEIERSGLRGRGGGGFPTGKKWRLCRNAQGSPKYVICNADEGDPGAYMDRSLLEGNPHSIIEGMLIGSYAIGAEEGYIYVRNEYPLAVEHARIAVQQARCLGLLGNNILGSGFSFDLTVARGAGAFVCGESTALIASLEGRVGEPSAKDVHTVERGLRDLPTNLNNVETWANVPGIIGRGAAFFAGNGSGGSRGTKIFALTGKVRNTGLVEVPMGTTLETIIYRIGGGTVDGSGVKAVQIGGPSGGCLPAELFGLPVDFEAMKEAGAMVGSGGLVVMDEQTCMVDVARYFLDFLIDESCGKCFPCRVGLQRMREIIIDIQEGRGTLESMQLLRETAETVSKASLCGLGKTAPNPVLTTMRYFGEEYRAHILEKRCPAGVCKPLIRYAIDSELCRGCGACAKACPCQAIIRRDLQGGKSYAIDSALCRKCGACREACPFGAIRIAREEALGEEVLQEEPCPST